MTINRRLFTQLGDATVRRHQWGRWVCLGLMVGALALFARCSEAPDASAAGDAETLVAQDMADLDTLQEALRTAYHEGVTAGRKELQPTVLAAYERGQKDALATVHGTPNGLELAQACLAMRGLR